MCVHVTIFDVTTRLCVYLLHVRLIYASVACCVRAVCVSPWDICATTCVCVCVSQQRSVSQPLKDQIVTTQQKTVAIRSTTTDKPQQRPTEEERNKHDETRAVRVLHHCAGVHVYLLVHVCVCDLLDVLLEGSGVGGEVAAHGGQHIHATWHEQEEL